VAEVILQASFISKIVAYYENKMKKNQTISGYSTEKDRISIK
jgi:hypothetical protein